MINNTDSQQLLSSLSYCVITLHREGGGTELVFGDPLTLGWSNAELSQGIESWIVGERPNPCPWMEPCASSLYQVRDSKGGVRWVESRSKPDGHGGLLVSTRGIQATQEVLLQHNTQVALSRLSLAGSLLGPMAHEINNIVQGLSSAEYLMRECLDDGDQVEVEDVDQLGEAANALKFLGSQVQAFARQRMLAASDNPEPKRRVDIENVELERVITRAQSFLVSMGKLKTIACHFHIAEEVPELHWYQFELEMIVLALLSNAADAALVSDRTPKIELNVVMDSDTGILLECIDSSNGLSFAQTPQVSDRTGRLELGLSPVLELITTRGGHIETAELDSGSVVRVRLPVNSVV